MADDELGQLLAEQIAYYRARAPEYLDGALEEMHKLRGEGIALWLAGLNPQVLDVVRRSTFGERLGQPRMFQNLDAAVREYERQRAAWQSSSTGASHLRGLP